MALFSYNRVYRDQTLSARITRGMFVASYKIIFDCTYIRVEIFNVFLDVDQLTKS